MNITKKEFEKDYYSMTIINMAKKLGVSVPTIHNIRRSLGIKPKGLNRKINMRDPWLVSMYSDERLRVILHFMIRD